jgi:hypothetical protein
MFTPAPPHRVFETDYGPLTVFTGAGSIFVSCAGISPTPTDRPTIVRFTRSRDGNWRPACSITARAHAELCLELATRAVAAAISDGLLDDTAAAIATRNSQRPLRPVPRQGPAFRAATLRLADARAVPTPTATIDLRPLGTPITG